MAKILPHSTQDADQRALLAKMIANHGYDIEQEWLEKVKAEVIENRLTVYEKNTAPLKSYYQHAGKFVTVDGVGEPASVFDRISKEVKS